MLSNSESGAWPKKVIVLSMVLVVTVLSVAYVSSSNSVNEQAAGSSLERNTRLITSYSCPKGTYETSRTPAGCVCALCPKGHKCIGGPNAQKEKCPIGQYQPATGQDSCKLADPGYYVPSTGQSAQKPCTPGNFQKNSGRGSCTPARKGHYVPGHKAKIDTPCDPGTYQPSTGQTKCLDSPPGHYVAAGGSDVTTPCPPGKYQPLPKQSVCKLASKGNYAPGIKNIDQTKCPHGSYQNMAGQAACKAASAGKYVPKAGATTQLLCPADTYQPCGGQHSCVPCPAERGSGPGATACKYYRVCVFGNGTPEPFAKFQVMKGGLLKTIVVRWVSGEFLFCGKDSKPDCRGYYGIQNAGHQFDLFFTRRNNNVLFPIKGNTVGMTPKSSGATQFPKFPFYDMNNADASKKQAVTLTNTVAKTVALGEEIRVHVGEVLYGWHPGDNLGKVCYNLELVIV